MHWVCCKLKHQSMASICIECAACKNVCSRTYPSRIANSITDGKQAPCLQGFTSLSMMALTSLNQLGKTFQSISSSYRVTGAERQRQPTSGPMCQGTLLWDGVIVGSLSSKGSHTWHAVSAANVSVISDNRDANVGWSKCVLVPCKEKTYRAKKNVTDI